MRSPVDGPAPRSARLPAPRVAAEWALRLLALGALLWALWLELRPRPEGAAVERAAAGELRAQLARWTRTPAVRRAHVSLDGVPGDTARDWIRALRGSGVALGYDSPPLVPVALAVEPVADPLRPVRLLAATTGDSGTASGTASGTDGGTLRLADEAGVIDSVAAPGGGASVTTPMLVGVAAATAGGVTARAVAVDSLALRTVVVLARAGWEGKFVAAALEERGWTVATRFAVAPGVAVTQGSVTPLDTARVAAVVALDTTAAVHAAAIARFVRAGGGLVLGAEAAAVPALAALAPGRLASPVRAASDALTGATPRHGLPLRPVVDLVARALPLERRGTQVAVAAQRVGAGRVVQLGYEQTWRWRMAGADGAPRAHRDWWAALLAAAAYAPALPLADAAPVAKRLDGAPVAALIAALGPAAPPPAASAVTGRPSAPWWLFVLAATALLAEWASRRQRGAR